MRTTASSLSVLQGKLSAGVPLAAALAVLLVCFHSNSFAIQHLPGDRGDQPPSQVAAADTLEPNDSPAQASLLSWVGNDARSGPVDISSGLDLDFYSVQLEAGDSLVAQAVVKSGLLEGFSPVVSILDSTGIVLASDFLDTQTAIYAAEFSGKFLVLVSDRTLLEGSPFTGEAREYELFLTRLLRRGDVDGSGVLDYRDAFIVFMLAAGLLEPESAGGQVLAAADMDGDGQVAGDMDDFRLLISRVEYIPSRDPDFVGKQKNSGSNTRLALLDGSGVELLPGGGLEVVLPGALADSAARLWASLAGTPQVPSTARPTLLQNSPNPFNPSTTISFNLPERAVVSLAVYSVSGKLVRTLAAGEFSPGFHSVHWDGTDNRGRGVAGGVYFYRLQAGSYAITRKLVILK